MMMMTIVTLLPYSHLRMLRTLGIRMLLADRTWSCNGKFLSPHLPYTPNARHTGKDDAANYKLLVMAVAEMEFGPPDFQFTKLVD